MKIIVTGGSGYIGSEFVLTARAAGHEIHEVGREMTDPAWLKLLDWYWCDALVHLAAAGVRRISPTRTWKDCIEVNFAGTRDLLLSLSASGALPVVFISGSIREKQARPRLDYWSDPYIVSQKLRRLFVEDWTQTYYGRVIYPFLERCEDPDVLCDSILRDIQAR